jgi:hypothetical protein
LDLTFSVEGQLFPQKEILSGETAAALGEAAQQSDEVQSEGVKDRQGMRKDFV